MDLDNIKKTWQEAKLTPEIESDKIRRMLDNRGQTAFSKLLKYEIFGLIVASLCIPLSFIFKSPPICTFYLVSVILIILWQIYKYRFLRRIDFSNMSILDISQNMVRYKKFLLFELIVAIIWVFIFALLSYLLVLHKADIDQYGEDSIKTFIYIAILITLPIIAATLGYRFMYIKNINKLEDSIKEIEYFEDEN